MTRWLHTSRSTRRRCVWLALCALAIQVLLPLLDAPLHHAAAHAGVAAPEAAPEAAPSDHQPGDASHDCVLCRFMAALGSFAPPSPARVPPPAEALVGTTPVAPPTVVRVAAGSAAQPRAPPSRA